MASQGDEPDAIDESQPSAEGKEDADKPDDRSVTKKETELAAALKALGIDPNDVMDEKELEKDSRHIEDLDKANNADRGSPNDKADSHDAPAASTQGKKPSDKQED